MKILAVICDVYGTLLDVSLPLGDTEARWRALCLEMLDEGVPFGLGEFHTRCHEIIAREHAAMRALGFPYPEIYWPHVATAALPGLFRLCVEERVEFLFRHAALRKSIALMPGAAAALRMLSQRGILLGLASNAQPYTLRELEDALAGANLSPSLFLPELTFWSFEHGFSKPDPHVFRLLSIRLQARGIAARETLMIGDRLDNDIEPAKQQGWRTWQFSRANRSGESGDWNQLSGLFAA